MGYERKYNELSVMKKHFEEALSEDFVKSALENFKPSNVSQKFVFWCVKNKKFKLAHFTLSLRNKIKGKR